MIKKVMISVIVLCFFIGCAPKEILKPLPSKTAKDFNKVEVVMNQENDTSPWELFTQEKDKYDEATIQIIEYTKEGDPIKKTLIKGKENYTLNIDHSEDEYRKEDPTPLTRTYSYLHRVPGSELDKGNKNYTVCFKEDVKDKDFWYLSNENYNNFIYLNDGFSQNDSYLLLITK